MTTTDHGRSAWARYRCWKTVIAPFLGLAATALLYDVLDDDFRPSLRWHVGLAIAATLGVAYVIEEVFWSVRNQARPCVHCGALLRFKPFRVKANCPHCGKPL